MEEVGEVLRNQSVLTFIGEEKEFIVYAELHRKPVQLLKGGGDVLPFANA